MTASLQETHEKVIQEREKYRQLFDCVQDYGIILLDASGYIETWNTGARKITGYATDEVIGKHFSLFYMPTAIDAGKPDKDLLRATQQDRIETEDWQVNKDGSRFWATMTLTSLMDKSGSLIGFAKIIKDMTERKMNEDALRTANKRLTQQYVELESLNTVKDEFISLASHQLRTPATGIKQFLGMLLEGYTDQLTGTQRRYIQKAYDSNERQIDLVNSLLRTAQVDAGKVILTKSPVDMGRLVDSVVGELQDVFTRRTQTVIVQSNSHIVSVQADEARLRMVLENLIDNASKYTDSGGHITITLSATKKYVKICVSDTGIGISPADSKHIFDKFNQIPNDLSGNRGGSGLGLYWVKKIIDLHQGTIHVSSQPGKGSVFTVSIPKNV